MGHIAEPEGVDFVIKSKPLTDKERKEISEFIQMRKRNKDEEQEVVNENSHE